MSSNTSESRNTPLSERQIRRWDWLVTLTIVVCLCIPLPFARFQAWPQGDVFLEKLVTPWSQFRLCYISFPEKDPVEELYRFTWKGKILSQGVPAPTPLVVTSVDEEPSIRWQKNPEIPLSDIFRRGDFIHVETFWQPLLLSPFRMMWHMRLDPKEGTQRDSVH